jgi:hypothetical protein
MPNHIFTTAHITGPPEALDAIWALAEEGESVLAHYLPLPESATEEYVITGADGTTTTVGVFSDTGYGTAIELWGSKWADYEVEAWMDDRTDPQPSIMLRFQSAWSPVVEGYQKLSTMLGITVVLTYEDEGRCYLGATAISDGKVVGEDYLTGEAAEKKDLFADVPAEPTDYDAADFEERQQEWYEAYNTAWSELLVTCEDNAFEALRRYKDGVALV